MQRACHNQHHVVDHVTIGAEVQELGQRLISLHKGHSSTEEGSTDEGSTGRAVQRQAVRRQSVTATLNCGTAKCLRTCKVNHLAPIACQFTSRSLQWSQGTSSLCSTPFLPAASRSIAPLPPAFLACACAQRNTPPPALPACLCPPPDTHAPGSAWRSSPPPACVQTSSLWVQRLANQRHHYRMQAQPKTPRAPSFCLSVHPPPHHTHTQNKTHTTTHLAAHGAPFTL
jgi:hypothetical protein